MKKYALLLFAVMFILGCGRSPKDKMVLAKINNYEISREEFEEEFKASSFGRIDTLDSRKEFLNTLIDHKLILQDAQEKDLDKDKNFLKMIQRFWEQSLLKLTVDKKTKEVSGSALVSDKTIEETYNRLLKEGKTDKTYEQMYQQIKWEVTKLKETQAMNNWVEGLRQKAHIKVNYDLLNEKK